jgi:ribosome-associated toxin RatA of RatAB toxin-antitoxin module
MAISGKDSVEISASVERIFATVADVEAWVQWRPGYTKTSVSSRDEQGRPSEIEVDFEAFGSLHRTHRFAWGDDWVSWEAIGASDPLTVGKYSLTSNGDTTVLVFEYTIDPKAPVPDLMVKPVMKKRLREEINALKTRAEAA